MTAADCFAGTVRHRDPGTSWDAAALQTPERVDARQRAILAALHRYGPMTDEQIADQLDAMRVFDSSIPASTPQAFRTARSGLYVGGRVIATHERRRTRSGATATVWAIGGDAQ
ncbi:hypothetical protein GCM10028798_19620 [Humibacter antri]